MLTHLVDYGDSSTPASRRSRDQAQHDQPASQKDNPPRQMKRVQTAVKRILTMLLILAVMWLGYKGVRIGIYGWHAYASGTTILDTARAGVDSADLAILQPEMTRLAAAVAGLENQVRPFAPVLRAMQGWTPYGATLAAAPDLLIAGAELTAMGAQTMDLFAPALSSEDELLESLISVVDANPEPFVQMAERAARADLALLAVPADRIHPALGGPMAQVQSLSPMMEPSLRAAQAFPDLLGMRKPVTYLILFQNNHELRGTGGFISAAGALTVNRGQISELVTENAYDVYSDTLEYAPPPVAMQRYLKSEILVFRDANWSPDLPTSGRTARQLYEQVRDVEIDGVITVDLNAVELLVDALGGIQIEGVEETITGENVVNIIKELWGNPLNTEATVDTNMEEWWNSRKDFVPMLAGAMLERLKTRDFDFMRLVAAGTEAMDSRSIQIWLDNPQALTQLSALGWDGALHPVGGADYLALVDSNVGFNKVNAAVTREISYTVTWPEGEDAPAQATAKITYVHPIAKPGHVCDPTPRYGENYDDMIKRCYFNYVRLYTPRNSKLISVEGVEEDSISSRRGEALTQVFAGYFIMKPGTVHTVTFTYELPNTIQEESYRLIAQRQSGSGPLPLRWQVGDGQEERTVIEGNWMDWKGE